MGIIVLILFEFIISSINVELFKNMEKKIEK